MHLTRTFRQQLSQSLREIRIDRFGVDDRSVAHLAKALGIPSGTWLNYESGVSMPAEIMLKFLDLTGVDHRWLLTGKGERYTSPTFGSTTR